MAAPGAGPTTVLDRAGLYRVRRRDDQAVFGHSSGPQSWKQFLHPVGIDITAEVARLAELADQAGTEEA